MKRYISSIDEKYYTYLLKVINSIGGRDLKCNWLITDIEVCPDSDEKALINNLFKQNNYLILSNNQFIAILEKNDFQWIWGVFSAIPEKYSTPEILKYELPFAEDNYDIYKDNPIIQHPLADIEIVAFDGSMVQITSRDNQIAELFRKTYPEASEKY